MYGLSKKEIERLLLNQSDKVVCERELEKTKKKYMHLRDVWKSYALSSKATYTYMRNRVKNANVQLQKEMEIAKRTGVQLNDMRNRVKNANVQIQKEMEIAKRAGLQLNAFEKKVERSKRSRSKSVKRYSP